MDLIVFGATGRMGCKLRERIAASNGDMTLAAAVSARGGDGVLTSLRDFTGTADCVVDFSHHSATAELLNACVERSLPVVIATTGQTEEECAAIRAAAEHIPVFFSANMSLGVAVLADLVRRAAALFPDADIEIVEIHHNRKVDVPSGTALMLGRAVQDARPEAKLLVGRHENGKRTREEVGIHSLRLGSEVGTHEVLISTDTETISLKHQAHDRALFADGALAAAAFLRGKAPGLYTMRDLIG